MPFVKGKSGNPGGRPKQEVHVKALARSHTEGAIKVLAEILNDKAQPSPARVSAATALLDRGWGRPAATVDMTVRRAIAKELSDDELADIAAGRGEGTDSEEVTPPVFN